MKIIAGLDSSFQGDVVWSPGYSVGYLPQEPQLDEQMTVREIVEEGVKPITDALKEYEEINNMFMDEAVLNDPDKMESLMNRQAAAQDKIEALGGWDLDNKLAKQAEKNQKDYAAREDRLWNKKEERENRVNLCNVCEFKKQNN
jgi:ATPase subunit of ABC transporter with duplicated ATPase domains